MKPEHSYIIHRLMGLLNANRGLRFGQALFSLGINVFADPISPENKGHLLKDIYNDSDETIIQRIKEQDKLNNQIKLT